MKRWRLIASVLLGVAACAGRGLSATHIRVAIVPPEAVSPYRQAKEFSESLADDLQGKLRDMPGVEWVERGDLDRLLAEVRPALDSGVSVSPMVLGRLLKADVILTGRLDDGSWKKRDGKDVYTSGLELQVIDLTNASVLAQAQWDFTNEVAGTRFGFTVITMDPGEFVKVLREAQWSEPSAALQRLQAMTSAQVAAEIHKSQAAELDKAAAAGRKLLAEGLAERRATAAATQLVPLFFANASTGPSLGEWEEKWQAALREEAAARPGVRLLQFLGIEQARQEQKLAVLGLTQADPAAWQRTADGYVWGNYQVVPGTQTTEEGELEVEAEVFLRLGGAEPQRFTRRCKAKDFPDAVRALAREVMDAAQGQHPRRSSEANAKIARMIFERLCGLVNGGFFQADPPLADTLPTANAHYIGTRGEAVLDPFKRRPRARESLAYCRQMLDLACFFDPDDNRLQMLRWSVANPPFSDERLGRDRQLDPMAECIEIIERIAHARGGFDVAAFATGVEAVMNHLTDWHGGQEWTESVGVRQTRSVPVSRLPAQREALMGIFLPLVMEKLPALSQRLDEAKIPLKARGFLAQWLNLVLEGNLRPEVRMDYLAAAWPYTPTEEDLDRVYLKLMDDLGDRKRVQSVLMQPKRIDVPPAAAPNANPPVARAQNTPPASPPSDNADEPLLAGWKPVEAPPLHTVELSLDQFSSGRNQRPPFPGAGGEQLAQAVEHADAIFVNRIDGFGDQLVLSLFTRPRNSAIHLLFETSSEAVRLLDSTAQGLVCAGGPRVFYRQKESVGWADLLSSERGTFSTEGGSPVAVPTTVGFDGAGRAVVGSSSTKTAAIFDWNERRWLLLPAPPVVPPVAAQPQPWFSAPFPAQAFGAGDAIVLPLWNLVFDQATQRWRGLPAEACPPLSLPVTDTDLRADIGTVAGSRICVDGHLWSWNSRGITDFSMDENRVVWHGDTRHLQAVCQDGPNLWLVLDRRVTSAPSPPESALVLLDRKQHKVLGAVRLPRSVTTIHADDHQLWLGGATHPFMTMGGGHKSLPLLCVDKAKLYAAIPPGAAPPVAQPPIALPANPERALYAAILNRDAAAVSRLLDHGAAASATVGDGKTPALMVAAWTGGEEVCRLLLRRGAAVDALLPTDHKTWTALAIAARQDDLALQRLLLDSGAKATEAALTEALRNANPDAAGLLIKAGAPLGSLVAVVEAQHNDELARRVLALHPALPPEEQARLSVLANANATLIPGLENDPKKAAQLIEGAARQQQWDQVNAIVGQLPASSLALPVMRQAFFWVIRGGDLAAVNAFLAAGISPAPTPDERQQHEGTLNNPLKEALQQPEIFRLFLQRGVDPHIMDRQEDTFAEHAAGSENGASILPLLLAHYPSLSTRFGYGTFGGALLCAAATGWPARSAFQARSVGRPATAALTLQLLLDSGVPPDAPGREGYTALHGAFAVRSVPMACCLAGAGADLQARDLAGRTVFDAPYCRVGPGGFVEGIRAYVPKSDAEARGRQRLLTALAARVNYPDLYDAVNGKNLARVRELLPEGSTVALPYASYGPDSAYSRNPGLVFLAVKNGDREMTRLLLEHGCDSNVGESGCYFYAQSTSLFSQSAQPYDASQRPSALLKCPTPLTVAAAVGDQEMVDLLLDHGAYAPTVDQFLRNAVDAAASPELGAYIAARARLQFEAEKLTAALGLGDSSAVGNPSVREIKAEAMDALLTPNAKGDTPLDRVTATVDMEPRWNSSIGTVMYPDTLKRLTRLHQVGIPLHGLDFYGTTPLHRAVLYAQAQNVAELVRTGFEPQFPDRRGITAIDLAKGILNPKQREDVLTALQQGSR